MKDAELLGYACTKFEEQKYDEALEAFVLAYSKGFEREWIIETIYNCYMSGNDEEFRNAFVMQASESEFCYEDCSLDFIPYREGEYYIFDKTDCMFKRKFSVPEMESVEPYEVLSQMEFSALGVAMDGNWKYFPAVLREAKERKIYVVCADRNRYNSYWKIPELSVYMKNIICFNDYQTMQEYFHKHTEIYLPQMFIGSEAEKQEFMRIRAEEHAYRLTPEGRNTSKVLLTIAIPTYNRGNLVLEHLQTLLQMRYDAEIEIAISKNGTELYQEEYDKVSAIPDARIHYFDHGRDLRPTENWCYVIGMAHGRYALFVSDEDEVILDGIEHYLKLLSTSETAVVRARSTFQSYNIKERLYCKKGAEAFGKAFLTQNYLSGMIIRTEDFIKEDLLKLDTFSDNPFYRNYPHEWWVALLTQKGDYQEEPVLLIIENESVLQEEIQKRSEMGKVKIEDVFSPDSGLPMYATYESRLAQFAGQIEFLRWMSQKNSEIISPGLMVAISKTGYLLRMARRYNHDCEHFMERVREYSEMCLKVIEEFPLEPESKMELLHRIKDWTEVLVVEHQKLLMEKSSTT